MRVKSNIVIVFSTLLFLTFSAPLVSARVNIMPLGDSITRGGSSGVVDPDFFVSYRKVLWDSLKAAGYEPDFVGSLTDGSATPDFDPNHEGHGGWRADQIAANVFNWLSANPANIVLLHIGTNDISGNNEDPLEIDDILDEIDRYETVFGENVWVVLAFIVNRSCDPYLPPCPKSQETTIFNSDVKTLVAEPRKNSGDKIITVDMEIAAGIDYQRESQGGDMWDDLHPFETGYAKMENVWFSGLQVILPVADAGPNQNVDENDTVTLDGSSSFDPDGVIDSYSWQQTGGVPSVILSDPTSVQPTFIAPDVGSNGETLTFKLTVTDNDGLESTDSTSIEVSNPTSSSGSSGGGGGCFIATAASGSIIEPQVMILREFRDRYPITNSLGHAFVDLYYEYSPPVADFIARNDKLRALMRWILLPLAAVSWMTLQIGPAPILALIILMFTSLVYLAGYRRKFRSQLSKAIADGKQRW